MHGELQPHALPGPRLSGKQAQRAFQLGDGLDEARALCRQLRGSHQVIHRMVDVVGRLKVIS